MPGLNLRGKSGYEEGHGAKIRARKREFIMSLQKQKADEAARKRISDREAMEAKMRIAGETGLATTKARGGIQKTLQDMMVSGALKRQSLANVGALNVAGATGRAGIRKAEVTAAGGVSKVQAAGEETRKTFQGRDRKAKENS